MTDDRAQLAALFRDIFEDDRRGAAILEHLEARFGAVQVHSKGGLDAILGTYKSAAQAAVIGYIHTMIQAAHGVGPSNVIEGDDEAPPV